VNLFSSIGFLDRLFFAKHLATLLKGGIPLAEALRLMADRREGKIGPIAGEILKSVENGQTLANSLAKHPQDFSPLFVSLVEIGEASGTLEKSLDFLAEKLTREETLRKKVKAMLFYPSIVLSVSVAVGGFVSFFVLPKLSGIFSSFDVELPLATRWLLALSGFTKKYGLESLIFLIIFIFLIRIAVGLSKKAKVFWHKLKFRLPFFGKVSKAAALASLFRNLGVMLQSSLPLERALQIESGVAENMVIQMKVEGLHAAVSRGAALGKELDKKEYGLFPALVPRMIAVGESSGRLEETFFYLADFFEDETDAAAKNGAALMEPLLLFFISVVAGFVALAVILPIYSLTGSIHQ